MTSRLRSQLTVFLHRASDREKAKLVLGAYFDESGTHADPIIFSFAGYLFTINRLRRFEREWLGVLSGFRLKVFHASDMETRQEKSEFADWSEEQCDRLVTELVAVINRCAVLGVSMIADAAAYQDFASLIPSDLSKAYRRAWADNPYVICMYKSLQAVSTFHAQRSRCNEPIACIFDERSYKGTITEIYERAKKQAPWGTRLGPLAFASEEVAIPLQAADLLAYLTRRHVIAMLLVAGSPEGQRLVNEGYRAMQAAEAVLRLAVYGQGPEAKLAHAHVRISEHREQADRSIVNAQIGAS